MLSVSELVSKVYFPYHTTEKDLTNHMTLKFSSNTCNSLMTSTVLLVTLLVEIMCRNIILYSILFSVAGKKIGKQYLYFGIYDVLQHCYIVSGVTSF